MRIIFLINVNKYQKIDLIKIFYTKYLKMEVNIDNQDYERTLIEEIEYYHNRSRVGDEKERVQMKKIKSDHGCMIYSYNIGSIFYDHLYNFEALKGLHKIICSKSE
jgi:hypothetical protein